MWSITNSEQRWLSGQLHQHPCVSIERKKSVKAGENMEYLIILQIIWIRKNKVVHTRLIERDRRPIGWLWGHIYIFSPFKREYKRAHTQHITSNGLQSIIIEVAKKPFIKLNGNFPIFHSNRSDREWKKLAAILQHNFSFSLSRTHIEFVNFSFNDFECRRERQAFSITAYLFSFQNSTDKQSLFSKITHNYTCTKNERKNFIFHSDNSSLHF